MSKSKSNKTGQAPGKQRAKTRVQRSRSSKKTHPHIIKHHVTAACSILNPFCVAAKAARRPDGLSSSTIPFQVRGMLTVATDASGYSLLVIVPGQGRYGYATGTYSAGNYTLGATWQILNGSTFINTNAAEVRIVSMGALFRSTASMTNCQGLLHKFVLTSPTVSAVIPSGNQNNVEDELTPLTAGYQSTWLSKPLGSAAHSFRPYTEVTNTMTDFNWSSVAFEIIGGAASQTVGYVEIVVNVEIHLNQTAITTTGLAGSTIARRPANPVALQTQAMVQSTAPSFIQGGIDKIESTITSFASRAVSSLLDSAEDFGLGLLGL